MHRLKKPVRGNRRSDNAGLKRFLLPIYIHSFLDEMVFIYSWYVLMFSDHGMSPIQISALLAAWSVVAFALEIPSGALADKYSRRNILIFAETCKICGFACWGLKSAFSSGTFEALVFDELKRLGAEDRYARVIGRTKSLSIAAVLAADVAGAFTIRFGYHFVLMMSLMPLTASCLALFLVRPAEKAESTGETRYFALLKEGVREAVKNRVVLRLLLFLSCGLVFFGSLEEFWTLFYRQAGISQVAIGLLCAGVSTVQMAAGLFAHRFGRLPDRVFYGAYALCGLLLLIAAYLVRPVSVAAIPIVCFTWVVTDVVMEARLQRAIAVGARATVLSVKGCMAEVTAIHINVGIGLTASKWGYSGGFMICAGIMMLVGGVYVATARRAAGD